jgi:hypothetical protein
VQLGRPAGAPAPLSLWDVENVPAHVTNVLRSWQAPRGARLSVDQEIRVLAYLLETCWEISGLEDDARTERWVWTVAGFIRPTTPGEPYEPIKAPQLAEQWEAVELLAEINRRMPERVKWPRVEMVRPTGAYDPSRGLSFSTYSYRLLTLRIADWYRQDPEFRDTRYGNGEQLISLEALVAQEHDSDDGWIDRYAPDGVDELNRAAFTPAYEEADLNAALGR